MAKNDGDQRAIATAQHIVRTLANNNEGKTEDMIRILSTFDDRFSNMNIHETQSFSYTTPSMPSALKKLEEELANHEETIKIWQKKDTVMIWDCEPQQANAYIHAVDQLYDLMRAPWKDESLIIRGQSALRIAISRLKEEFRCIVVLNSEAVDGGWLLSCTEVDESNEPDGLSAHSVDSSDDENENEDIPIAHPVTAFDASFDLIPPERISDLNTIAQCLARIGFLEECSKVYVNVRKTVLEQSLYRLGLEKPNVEFLQKMNWESLEVKIRKWIQSFRVAIKVIFSAEKKLCDQVFNGLNTENEASFIDLVSTSFTQYLLYANTIAMTRRTPEKLFKFLDMYEVCKELMPEINNIFRSENALSEARRVMDQIGEAARGCLQEFEVGIQKDSSRKEVPGGSFHPLTRYVMNYIKLLLVYSSSLEQLLRGRRREIPRSLGVETFGLSEGLRENNMSNEAEQLSPLAIQVMWLIVHLESNLEGKSKLYLDPSMSFLFLMNNTHYIVTKVKQSELVFLLKDRWIRKHSAQVRVYSSNYVNAAWLKVFSCLREEGLGSNARSGNNGISRFAIKDRLKNFNQTFDEVCAAQSSAVVPDPDLREHLRLAIAEKLLPMYRTFFERYSNLLEGGTQSDKYFKYTYDDLENKIIDLFDSHP